MKRPEGMHPFVYEMLKKQFEHEAFGVAAVAEVPAEAQLKDLARERMTRLYDQQHLNDRITPAGLWLVDRLPTSEEEKYFREEARVSMAFNNAFKLHCMTLWPRPDKEDTDDEINEDNMSLNYKDLTIQSAEITLTSVSKNFVNDILAGNTGNVRDFFIPFESKKDVEAWIESNFELMEKGEKIELVILNQKREFVGMLSLRDMTTNPTFGLWIKTTSQKQGYAKKSMKLFIDWLFANTDLNKLIYTVDTKNAASIALAKSLNGMHTKDFVDTDGKKASEFVFYKSNSL